MNAKQRRKLMRAMKEQVLVDKVVAALGGADVESTDWIWLNDGSVMYKRQFDKHGNEESPNRVKFLEALHASRPKKYNFDMEPWVAQRERSFP